MMNTAGPRIGGRSILILCLGFAAALIPLNSIEASHVPFTAEAIAVQSLFSIETVAALSLLVGPDEQATLRYTSVLRQNAWTAELTGIWRGEETDISYAGSSAGETTKEFAVTGRGTVGHRPFTLDGNVSINETEHTADLRFRVREGTENLPTGGAVRFRGTNLSFEEEVQVQQDAFSLVGDVRGAAFTPLGSSQQEYTTEVRVSCCPWKVETIFRCTTRPGGSLRIFGSSGAFEDGILRSTISEIPVDD